MNVKGSLHAIGGGNRIFKFNDPMNSSDSTPLIEKGWTDAEYNLWGSANADGWFGFQYNDISMANQIACSLGGYLSGRVNSCCSFNKKIKDVICSYKQKISIWNDGYSVGQRGWGGVLFWADKGLTTPTDKGNAGHATGLGVLLDFSSNNARIIGNGNDVSNVLTADMGSRNVWYNVEVHATRKSAEAHVWKEGATKPAQPNLITNVAIPDFNGIAVKIAASVDYNKGYPAGTSVTQMQFKDFKLEAKI